MEAYQNGDHWRLMKQAVTNIMRTIGAFAPFRMANRNKALILTYHRFSAIGGSESTSPRSFAKQLEYLTTRYRIVPLTQLVAYLTSGEELPPRIAAITIDDGYLDAYEIAFPILRVYKTPATIFVVTDFVDKRDWLWPDKLRFLALRANATKFKATIDNREYEIELAGRNSRLETAGQINAALKLVSDDAREDAIGRIATELGVQLPVSPPNEYEAISWDQAREMERVEVTMGSHTATHPILTRTRDDRLNSELSASRSCLESMLRRKVDLFCYPNGDYDERVVSAVKAAGYESAVTIEAGFNGLATDPLRLRRVHTENNLARFIQKTSGFDQVKSRLINARPKPASERFLTVGDLQ